MDRSALGPEQRRRDLRRLAEEHLDVLVIGGGVTGAGCALDAATRGLSVGLVERRDWAAGTSSRSSKLIHGGLRYLEQFDFRLVFEALGERSLLLDKLCPHLVQPVSFLYPLEHKVWERPYVGSGILLYDLLAKSQGDSLPWHRHLTRKGVRRRFPAVAEDAIFGGVIYWDAQVDDARHTLAVGRTAAANGAAVATSTQVEDLIQQGERVVGARVRDLETGEHVEVRARQVINATGVWTDRIQDMTGRGKLKVRASKGIHLLVARDRIAADTGIILRTASSVLFIIPWGQHWLIGTTDTDWNLDLSHPAASRSDIDYLLERVNAVLLQPLDHDDIEGVYAGLRPLLSGESDETSKLSREHAVSQPVPGLTTIAGGKYTTYRVMAEDAVDAAMAERRRVPRSVTEDVLLVGAEGWAAAWNSRERIAAESGLELPQVEHLLHRHGSRISDLIELIGERPELAAPLAGGGPYLRAEVVYACSHEGALHLDDVLARRTRLSIETPHRGVDCAVEAAELMAGVLGWDQDTAAREVELYRTRVRFERESQTKLDDPSADETRLLAKDARDLASHPPS